MIGIAIQLIREALLLIGNYASYFIRTVRFTNQEALAALTSVENALILKRYVYYKK